MVTWQQKKIIFSKIWVLKFSVFTNFSLFKGARRTFGHKWKIAHVLCFQMMGHFIDFRLYLGSRDTLKFGHTQFFIEICFKIFGFLNIFPFLTKTTDTLQYREDSPRFGLSDDESRDYFEVYIFNVNTLWSSVTLSLFLKLRFYTYLYMYMYVNDATTCNHTQINHELWPTCS